MSLKALNISYTYQKKTPFEHKALNNVSVEIPKGSFTGIIGRTGCGKSTLLKHFNELLTADEGKIIVDDVEADSKNVRDIRKKVGLVFQYPEYQLFEDTVYRDVAYGLNREKISDEEKKERVIEALKTVGLDESYLERSPYELSGGRKRRVALAGVIVMKPQYLILDEPAAGLDPVGRRKIFSYIKKLQTEQGITIALVSHSMEDMADYADNLIVMDEGVVVTEDTPEKVFRKTEMLEKLGLAVPQISKVWEILRKEFPELPDNIYTVQGAAEEIKKYMGGENK